MGYSDTNPHSGEIGFTRSGQTPMFGDPARLQPRPVLRVRYYVRHFGTNPDGTVNSRYRRCKDRAAFRFWRANPSRVWYTS